MRFLALSPAKRLHAAITNIDGSEGPVERNRGKLMRLLQLNYTDGDSSDITIADESEGPVGKDEGISMRILLRHCTNRSCPDITNREVSWTCWKGIKQIGKKMDSYQTRLNTARTEQIILEACNRPKGVTLRRACFPQELATRSLL